MKRGLSLREMILLGVLVVLAAYYFMVQGPVTKELEALERQKQVYLSEISLYEKKLTQKQQMESELRDIFEKAGGDPAGMPVYNNMNSVITELNSILFSADDYSINFSKDETDGNIMRRSIAVSFSDRSYDSVVEKVEAIEDSRNFFLIRNINIVRTKSRENTESCSADLTVVEYEYVE